MTSNHYVRRCPIWQQVAILITPLAIGSVAPPVIRAGFQAGLTNTALGEAFSLAWYGYRLDGLGFLFWWGQMPFLLLTAAMWRFVKQRPSKECYILLLSGLLGVLCVTTLVHGSYWRAAFGSGHTSSTSSLVFAVAPAWGAAGGIVGIALGRWITKRCWPDSDCIGLCLECGYDLTGNVSGRCPECGTLIPIAGPPSSSSKKAGERTSRYT